jgi:hypothetical protein
LGAFRCSMTSSITTTSTKPILSKISSVITPAKTFSSPRE